MPRSTSLVGVTSSAPWIPLRDDYFDVPLLSAKEKAYLVRKSCEAAQEVVERARSAGGPIKWRHVEKHKDVQIYAGFARGAFAQEPTSMCGVTTVSGSVKEVAMLFDLSTSHAMKDFGLAYPGLFFDAVVLHTLSPRTKEKPLHQVTAKWIAVAAPRGMDNRDFCYLECQDKFMDSSGRKGWVMCLHSIKLPGCDDLSHEFGLVRGSFYHSGIIVVEADRPGFVDVIHMLQINLKNNTGMDPQFLRDRVAFVSKIKSMLRVRRLNDQRYLSDLELVPKKYRTRCNVCQDSFSLLLLRKMNCRKCGEVVCGACSKEFEVTNAKFLEPIKLRICVQCYQMIAAGQLALQHSILEPPRQSIEWDLLGYHEDNQRASVITEMPNHHPNARGGREDGRRATTAGGTRRTRHQPTRIVLQSMRGEREPQRRSHSGARVSESRARSSDRHTTMVPHSSVAHAPEYQQRRRETEGGRFPPTAYDVESRDERRMDSSRGDNHHRPSGRVCRSEQPSASRSGAPRPDRHSRQPSRHTELHTIPKPPPPQPQNRPRRAVSASSPVPTPPPPAASLFDRERRVTNEGMPSRPVREHSSRGKATGPSEIANPRSARSNTRTNVRQSGKFKIPHSLYDYSSVGEVTATATAPKSPTHRRDSTSSVSSTGSIDIDSYELGDSNAPATATASISASALPLPNHVSSAKFDMPVENNDHYQQEDFGDYHDYDDDTEGSVGSGDDEVYMPEPRQPLQPRASERKPSGIRRGSYDNHGRSASFAGVNATNQNARFRDLGDSGDDGEEETKAQEFSATPALQPPSPSSAQTAMQKVLSSSIRDSQGSRSSIGVPFTQGHDPWASAESHDSGDVPFPNRATLNFTGLSSTDTADCDTSYLDEEMREFHDQPFVMRDPRHNPNASLDTVETKGGHAESGERTSMDQVNDAMSTTPNSAVTSPKNSTEYAVRPPLYGIPKRNLQSSILSTDNSTSTKVSHLANSAASIEASSPSIAERASKKSEGIHEETIFPSDQRGERFSTNHASMVSAAPSDEATDDLVFMVPNIVGVEGGSRADAIRRSNEVLSASSDDEDDAKEENASTSNQAIVSHDDTQARSSDTRLGSPTQEDNDQGDYHKDAYMYNDSPRFIELTDDDEVAELNSRALPHSGNGRTGHDETNSTSEDQVGDMHEFIRPSSLYSDDHYRSSASSRSDDDGTQSRESIVVSILSPRVPDWHVDAEDSFGGHESNGSESVRQHDDDIAARTTESDQHHDDNDFAAEATTADRESTDTLKVDTLQAQLEVPFDTREGDSSDDVCSKDSSVGNQFEQVAESSDFENHTLKSSASKDASNESGNQTSTVSDSLEGASASRASIPSYLPSRFQRKSLPSADPSTPTFEPTEKADNSSAQVSASPENINALPSVSNQEPDHFEVDHNLVTDLQRQEHDDRISTVTFSIPADPFLLSGDGSVESSDSDSEQDLLSARRMFRKFGSTKRLERMVTGVNKNPSFQRTFDEIQQSIDMLSDSDDDDEIEYGGGDSNQKLVYI